MSVNSYTNTLSLKTSGISEKSNYGSVAPTSTTGNIAGDYYYVSSNGTSTGNITDAYRWDGSKWIKQPGSGGGFGLSGELAPVKDFKDEASLLALTANDQDSYIVTSGSNAGKIATWSSVSNSWVYYTPSISNITTMTNPDDPLNQGKWKYTNNGGTAGWVQTEPSIVIPPTVNRVVGGSNIAFPSRHNDYVHSSDNGFGIVLQNDRLLAYGYNTNFNYGDGSAIGQYPRTIPFSWWNLDGNNSYIPIAKYAPVFTDFDFCDTYLIASDQKGKIWIQGSVAGFSGHTTTPTSNVVVATNPVRALYPVQFFQGRDDIIASRVYTRGVVFNTANNVHAVLDTNGKLWVTGYGLNGELGQGNSNNLVGWAQWGTIANIVEVKISTLGIFALTKSGDLYYSGIDILRFLGGAANNVKYTVPTLVLTNVKTFDFGDDRAAYLLAVKNDNTLWVGGNNSSGQLGLGTTVQQVGMVQVAGITNASSVYCDKTNANSLFSCLLRTNGTISFAGNNKGGVFGFTPNASAVNNTTFVTPTFAAQGTIKDVLATLNAVIIITTTGDIWRTGTVAVGGLGHTVPGSEPFGLKNCWKQMPCPEPVLAMRAFTTLTTPTDGVLLLTGNRGLIGFGHRNAFVTNLYYTSPNYSFREMGDIRQYDNGIAVTNPISQVI